MESDFEFLFDGDGDDGDDGDSDGDCLPPELGFHAGNWLLYGSTE